MSNSNRMATSSELGAVDVSSLRQASLPNLVSSVGYPGSDFEAQMIAQQMARLGLGHRTASLPPGPELSLAQLATTNSMMLAHSQGM